MRDPRDQNENKVTLQLPDYLSLYEFKKNLEEKGLVLKTWSNYNGYTQSVQYLTLDEAWGDINKINDELHENIDKLHQKNNELHVKLNDAMDENRKLKKTFDYDPLIDKNKKLSVDDIKQFTIWQFLRWRKSKK